MAHSLSAKKRVRQAAKRRETNRTRKTVVKVSVKKFAAALATGAAAAETELKNTVKVLDRMATKGTIHKNTAARRKSKLAKKVNAAKAAKA